MTIRKMPNGKYRVRVDMGTTLEGKRDQKQRTFPTLREAKRFETAMKAERDALRGRSGKMTLRAYVEGWYSPLMDSLAASSRDTYEREIRLRILPYLGNLDIRDIDRAQIQRMVDSCKTKRVAEKALGTLKTILNEARSDGLIAVNPATFRYRMPPKGKRRDNGLVIGSFAEMKPVFERLESWDDPTCLKLAVTGFLMGLRPEERIGLNWEDFDWAESTVHIRRAVVQVPGKIDVKAPKTEGSDRVIPVPDYAKSLLMPLRSHESLIETGSLMKGPDGHRISPSTLRKRWKRFLRMNPGLPQVTVENMRHSFATSFLNAGGNVENLSRILGHSDINTTFQRYVKPTVGNLGRDMGRVAV